MSSATQIGHLQGYSPPDPRVLEWLLSALARRLYGAVDLGLLSCLELPPEEYVHFVARHFTEPMRALARVIQMAVAETRLAPPLGPLEGVYVWTEAFAAALSTARQFRSLPTDEVRGVADALKRAWGELHRCIRDLARALGLELSFAPATSPEGEHKYQTLLDGLARDLEAEREKSWQ